MNTTDTYTYMKKRDFLKFYLIYTLLFCVICAVIYQPFLVEQKSLVYKIDGMPQYTLWLQYTGKYIRNLIKSIVSGNVNVPMYDFNIGMGNDVRSFFKTEPVGFLGTLLVLGTKGTSKLYNLMTIFRIYLIGVSFSCYGFYMKKKPTPVLAGALIYTFSTFTTYQVARHPQFAVPIIMLPLLLIGLERLMKKEGYLFFTFCVAVSLMASYYFLYMNTLIMGIYALLRLGDIYSTNRIREFFGMMGRIIRYYLLGVGMTLLLFIPSVAGFFLSARKSGGNKASAIGSFLHYEKYRAIDEFLALSAPVRQGATLTAISVGVMIMPVLILFLTNRSKERRSLQLGFLIGVVFLMVPFFGYVFSGFSTVNNRWSFAFVFILAMIMTLEFENILSMKIWQYALLYIVIILYVVCRQIRITNPNNVAYKYIIILMLLVYPAIGLLRFLPFIPRRLSQAALILLVCGTVATNGHFLYAVRYGNLIDQFQNEATVNLYYEASRYSILKQIKDKDFCRMDTDMMYHNYNNSGVALGYNGVSLYQSTINSSVISFYKESENAGISALNRTVSLDNRTTFEELACVKYFLTFRDQTRSVPYGFEKDEKLSAIWPDYAVYKNKYALPIGYNYDQIISRSEYEKMNKLRQQQIQLDAAVVNDKDLDKLDVLKQLGHKELAGVTKGSISEFHVEKGIKQKNNTFDVKETELIDFIPEYDKNEVKNKNVPKITFTTTSRENCEVYLRFRDVITGQKKRNDINVYTDDIKKRAIVRGPADTYGLGLTDYIVNLGYYDKEEKINVKLSFSGPGKYTIGEFEIYYVPMDTYAKSVEGLKTNALEDVSITTNTVAGTTSSDHDHLIVFSIPYHIGWSAFIDDLHTEVFNINTMYMGVLVPAGEHEVVMQYHSPGIRIGIAISTISWYIFLFLLFKERQKKKEKKKAA